MSGRQRNARGQGELFAPAPSPRTLVLFAPAWPFIARGIPPEAQAAVVGRGRVVTATVAATRAGVATGERVPAALQKSSGLGLIEEDPETEGRAFEKVAALLETFCPEVEVFPGGGCAFEVRGPAAYFGGEESLLAKVISALDALELEGEAHLHDWRPAFPSRPGLVGVRAEGLSGRWYSLGVADGLFAAKAASRYGVAVAPGASREFLAGFPIGVFGRGEEVVTLADAGIKRVGDLAALPRRLLAERFGVFGVNAFDLAMGVDPRRLSAREAREESSAAIEFDPPAYLAESIVFSMRAGAVDLFSSLERRGEYPLSVRISFETENAESISRVWSSNVPISLPFLVSWARWQLDAWTTHTPGPGREPPSAGVIRCDVVVLQSTNSPSEQLDFYSLPSRPGERVTRSVERVRARLGQDSVRVPRAAEGRSPRDQFRLASWRMDLFSSSPPRLSGAPWPGRMGGEAPAQVFDPPLAAALLDGDGSSLAVSPSGRLSAEPASLEVPGVFEPARRVASFVGPWPMTERWWDPARSRRLARLQLRLDGGVMVLVLVETSRWHLEAVYD